MRLLGTELKSLNLCLQNLSNFDDEKFFTNQEKCSIILLELTQNKFFQI